MRAALRRGWFFGDQAFREGLLKLIGKKFAGGANRREDGYSGVEVQQHDEYRAEQLVAAGLEVFGLRDEEQRRLPCNDWRKRLLAEVVQCETTVKLDWIRRRLDMGDRSYCCRLIRRTRERLAAEPMWQRKRQQVLKMSINDD